MAARILTALLLAALLAGCSPRPEPPGSDGGIDVGQALGGSDAAGYARATEVRAFRFPADHGPHPDFRNEWWYFTGHLHSVDGRRYGFQLTLFRIALAAPDERVQRPSNWAADQVYMGHFAVSDIDGKGPRRFRAFERFARAAAGLAGAELDRDALRVWLEDWSIERDADGGWRLAAGEDGVGLNLRLEPQTDNLLQGDRGLSQKSEQPGNASYYYSIPRLAVDGRLELDDRATAVAGSAWLDREWSTSALGPDQAGWDWFSLQLDDGGAVMYYQLRRRDGSVDPHSAGVYLAPDGRTERLGADDVKLDVLAHWQSPHGGRYPARWRIAAHALPGAQRPLLGRGGGGHRR